jgi:hypothetical protein
MDQNMMQILKMYLQNYFIRILTNHAGNIHEHSIKYSINNGVLNVACAWNQEESETLHRC